MTPLERGLTVAELTEGLWACLPVQRWVDDVLARAPFSSMLEVMDVAATAATPLSPDEIDEALAAQPPVEDEALAAATAAYQQKFGRRFAIRTDGRDAETVAAELQRRLQLDPQTELACVEEELRDLALLRIPKLFR